MALAQVDGLSAGGVGLTYDVRVVAALALCVLALPPVVNAIMAKAAEQADTEWLRDQDFDGDPELDNPPPFDFQPPPGSGDPPPDAPPPRDRRERPPPPQCNLEPTVQRRSLTDVSNPQGVLTLTLQRDDRGIAAFVNGTQVTGRPLIVLAVDGDEQWRYNSPSVGGDVARDYADPEARAPQEWTLTYDLGGVVYNAFELELMTVRCEAPTNG